MKPIKFRALILTAAAVAEVQQVSLPAAKQRIRRGRAMLVSALARGVERRAALAGVPLNCWDARSRIDDYLADELRNTQGGRNLLEIGHQHDLHECARIDLLKVVPEFNPATGRITLR